MAGKLTDKSIDSLCFGVIESGKRRGEYRKYRLEGTEWNTDNGSMVDTEGRMRSKYADGGSMYLLLTKKGSKVWHFDYAFDGKRKTISFGTYPATSLSEARKRLMEAKELLSKGIDPGQDRKEKAEAVRKEQTKPTFESVALEWFKLKVSNLRSAENVMGLLKKNVFSAIGDKPIADVTRQDVVGILRAIEARGSLIIARQVCQLIVRIFDYALILGLVEHNVGHRLSAILQGPAATVHRASIKDPHLLGAYLRDMDRDVRMTPERRQFLRILPYVFTRPVELAGVRWSELDFDKALWTIPVERMKKRREHTVPLSRQVIAMFREMEVLTGDEEYVFYSPRTKSGFIEYKTLLTKLRGYEGEAKYGRSDFSLHGFRSTASTMLHEMGYRSEWIEMQLAHLDSNQVRAAYNLAQYIDERRKMVQEWANYLDKLKGEKDG